MSKKPSTPPQENTSSPSDEDRYLDLWEENIRLAAINTSRPISRARNG